MDYKFLKSLAFVTLATLLFARTLQAQTTGSISGTLVDGSNNQTLPFATVFVTKKNSAQPPKGMQTDINGKFKMTGLALGTYTLKATFVDYATFIKDTLVISNARKDLQLGNLKMRPAKSVLKEVTVNAQKSEMKLGIDKKSFDVSQSLVSQGGSATDLLANVPSVQVDVDGNLSLRGSTNVRVLINGKPSTLTGSNLTDILQSIPASSIETIEVITNPSSKYDAEGQSGIINIVMKKNSQQGFTGSASLTAGTQNTYNGTLSLAYQKKKINIYGNYSYRSADRIGNGFIDKSLNTISATPPVDQYTNQISNQTFHYVGSNIRSGIDYSLDDKNTISFSNNINIRDRNLYQNGLTTITQNGLAYGLQNQNNTSAGTGTNIDLSLDYDHKFKKKQEELTANVTYSDDRNDNNQFLNTSSTYYSPFSYQPNIYNEYTNGHQRNINSQADYTLPLKDGRFEAGFRSTIARSDNNYVIDTLNSALTPPAYQYSPTLSNDFLYKQYITAGYANYQHQFGKFGVQGGLRLEDAHINSQLSTNSVVTTYTQDYLRLYPTLFLTEKLTDNETIQLSYSRRVTRPTDRQLSPFIDLSNKENYTQGNPNLRPEDTHSAELSYINYWTGITLTSSLYYRLTNDNIQQVLTPLSLNTNITTYQNIASSTNAGYELIAKINPVPLLDLTANVNVYYAYVDGYQYYLNGYQQVIAPSSGYSYNGNLTAGIKATKKLSFQLRGDYQGAQPVEQGRNLARYGLDGGLKYDITKALSFSVNSRDIFNTRKFETIYNVPVTNINNVPYTETETSSRRFATRTVLFTLSYRIGSNTANKKAKEKTPTDQDIPEDPNGGGGNNQNKENQQGTLGQPPIPLTLPKATPPAATPNN